jgi:dTDP-4-amino-4,6-dideoxygalactose transaminase
MPGPGLDLFGSEEEAEVLEVLRSRELSRYRFDDNGTAHPSKVYNFERRLEALTGARHCLGTNSCTSALLAGLWAAGLGRDCEVIVPGYTFVASIAAIAYSGATPVLAEIDDSLTLDPADVERRITARTRGIMAVHMLGAPCDMPAIEDIARRHSLILIEDCAQAGGGCHGDRHLGTFGSFGAFSLNVFKTFTAGDGGVLLTNDTSLYERAFAIHDHGARPFRVGVADADSLLGLNLRMHELTGAVAGAQLIKLPASLKRLRRNKARLSEAIGQLPGVRERKVHDRSGECATVLAFIFDTATLADAVSDSLGAVPLSRSGKHNYANIPQLNRRNGGTPLLPGGMPALPRPWPAGALPRTDDVLARTVALSVGVVDSYLGTGFGIDINAEDDRIAEVADGFRRAVLRAVGEVVE